MGDINLDMLILAREARRLTQEDLANRIGVTQGTISKAEGGVAHVSDDLVRQYAEHLRYQVSFFSQTPPTLRLPITFYRKRKSVKVPAVKAIDAQMRILRMHLMKLTRSVEMPPMRVPLQELRTYRGSASDLAREIRLRWHIPDGPIENMTKLVESLGCFVIKWNFDVPDVDGLSIHEPELGLPPIIVVDPAFSGDRLRFTIAHELAHIVLHHHLPMPGDNAEAEADEWAAEFTMPREQIRPFMKGLSIDKLAQLKSHWKMSMQAILSRAHDLDAISDSQRSRLWATINRLGFVKSEPVRVPVEEPSHMNRLTTFHMQRLGYSTAEMCTFLSIFEDEFSQFVPGPAGRMRVVR